MSFPCTGCGLCCRHIDRQPLMKGFDRGDGTCVNFDVTTARCTIYESRPDICRVDDSYPRFSSEMTLIQFYKANAEVCNALQVEHGMPDDYRVTVKEEE